METTRAGGDMNTGTSIQADSKQDLETAAGSEDRGDWCTQKETKASPVPKVIKGMLVKANTHLRPINSTSTDSPSKDLSLAGNGNPLVKGRKSTLESNGQGVARQSDGACPSGQVKSAPGTVPHASPKGTTTSVPLTEGWQEDVDPRSGKKFYVNHKIKKWSWNLPIHVAAAAAAAAAQETAANPAESSQASIAADEERVRLQEQRATKSSGPLPSSSPAHIVNGQGSREWPTPAVASDARSNAFTSSSVPEILEHQTMPTGKEVLDPQAILPSVQKMLEHEASEVGRRMDTDPNPENAPRQDTNSSKVVLMVPPLKISARDIVLRHEDDACEAPVTLNSKWSRVEHDREVEELKSEIHLIRSQSKQKPRKSESWDAHPESISHREFEPKLHGHTASARSASKLKSQGSPLTKVDIYQIRKAPYTSKESSLAVENAGHTYKQVEAAQYSSRGGTLTPRSHIYSSSFPSGSITARGRIESVTESKYTLAASQRSSPPKPALGWDDLALEARLAIVDIMSSTSDPRSSGKQMQRLVKASEKLLLAGAHLNSQVSSAAKRNVAEADSTRDHDANLRIQEHREWQIRKGKDSTKSNAEELLHTISCLRDQQTYLLKALKECSTIISSEMNHMKYKGQDCNVRCDQAASGRDLTDSQVQEQVEEIQHIQKGISQPSIEDLVLISQLNGVVQKLMQSREKHSVQVEVLKTTYEHLEQGHSFLHQVQALLGDCLHNLESSQGTSHTPRRDAQPSCSQNLVNDAKTTEKCIDDANNTPTRKAGENSKGHGQLSAEVVRIAAELEDACTELHWMVGLIAQLGEDAMNSSTLEGQHRSLLMQQEQMNGFTTAVNGALCKASNVMARVTSALLLPFEGMSHDLNENLAKLRASEGVGPDSRTLWHQIRYHRDFSAWTKERDNLLGNLRKAEEEADSYRATLGSQSLKLHELHEALQSIENAKVLQTSDANKTVLELKRALEAERAITTEKHVKIEELEILLQCERQHSERVVRQAVSTLESMEPEKKLKRQHVQAVSDHVTESMPTRDKPSSSVEITEHPRYQLHAQLIEQEQRMHTVLDLPVQDTTLYTKDYAPPAGSSLRGPPPKDSNGLTTHNHQTSACHTALSGVLHFHKGSEGEKDFRLAKPAMPGTSQVKFAGSKQIQGSNNTVYSQKLSIHSALADEYDDQTSVEEADSSKLSFIGGWEDSTQFLDEDEEEDKKIENVSSSSETASLSDNLSNDGSERGRGMQCSIKSILEDQGEEDPFERFRKWHARTSFPRDLASGGNQSNDRRHSFPGDGSRKRPPEIMKMKASGQESLPSVMAWNPNMLPSEWLISGRVIEALNLPKPGNNQAGSYICCISLIQDLKGLAYQRYLFLDHQRVLHSKRESADSSTGLEVMGSPQRDGGSMRIRPQHISRPSTTLTHPVWEEEVTLVDMHPNPVVLERLHVAGQLALSNERVLLSGLPVHVLVSVQSQNQANPECIKGHYIIEPRQPCDVRIDLTDASGKRLTGPSGKNASILVNLSYEPLHHSILSPDPSPGQSPRRAIPPLPSLESVDVSKQWNLPMQSPQASGNIAALC